MEQIIQGDCLERLKDLPDNSVDSIVTDPPYELGFMGKSWDNTGIANNVDMWSECLRVLKPGGHLLSFGGTRTYHRMACAIEDAGFEIRDMIAWVYGSGFPKSLNIGKAVDKIQGNERVETGEERFRNVKPYDDENGWNSNNTTGGHKYTRGNSEWEGWGTALKPALEPITVARKPLIGTVAENVLKWGTGGINIDGCRVQVADSEKESFAKEWDREQSDQQSDRATYLAPKEAKKDLNEFRPTGRFPANLIHDGSEEVVELFPKDSHRFFYCAKASKSERNKGCEGLEEKQTMGGGGFTSPQNEDGDYIVSGNKGTAGKYGSIKAKASNHHPTVKPLALMEYLIKLVSREGAVILDPFMGSGTTGVACKNLNRNFIGIEREEEYIKIAEARLSIFNSGEDIPLTRTNDKTHLLEVNNSSQENVALN